MQFAIFVGDTAVNIHKSIETFISHVKRIMNVTDVRFNDLSLGPLLNMSYGGTDPATWTMLQQMQTRYVNASDADLAKYVY